MSRMMVVRPRPGPRIKPGTVRIYRDEKVMRLSPDLLDGLVLTTAARRCPRIWRFLPTIGLHTKLLHLQWTGSDEHTLTAWRSQPGAKSLLIHVSGILGMLDLKNAAGVYPAGVDKRRSMIVVNLSRRLK